MAQPYRKLLGASRNLKPSCLPKRFSLGFLAGDSGPQMARRLKGRLKFADFGPLSVRQLAQAGGQLTAVANHQVNTLVRTSVNQVANAISQATYKANAEITEKYKYVATLDSRTSARCRALDQQVFAYGKGPLPPQHFNCRSDDSARDRLCSAWNA